MTALLIYLIAVYQFFNESESDLCVQTSYKKLNFKKYPISE